jgi:hypothetical protein
VSCGAIPRFVRCTVATTEHVANKWVAVSITVCSHITHAQVDNHLFFEGWLLCEVDRVVATKGKFGSVEVLAVATL